QPVGGVEDRLLAALELRLSEGLLGPDGFAGTAGRDAEEAHCESRFRNAVTVGRRWPAAEARPAAAPAAARCPGTGPAATGPAARPAARQESPPAGLLAAAGPGAAGAPAADAAARAPRAPAQR